MSNRRVPEDEQRQTPSVSGDLSGGIVPVRSNLRAESFSTRLSTRHRKPSEHVARKCCACSQAALSPRSDQGRPHRLAGDAKKAAVKKTSLLPSEGDSVTRRKSSALTDLFRFSRERASVKVQQDASQNKCGTRGKASASLPQNKSREAQTSRTTLIKKQPAMPPNGTREKTASPPQVWRPKVQPKNVNVHKNSTAKPVSPAQVGLSKQPSKKTYSCPTTSKLKKPAVPNIRGKDPQGQKYQTKKTEAELAASNCQSKLSTDTDTDSYSDSDSDSDSSACGSDWSSETSDLEHHITSSGFDHGTGWNCGFCEEDLAVASWGEDEHMTEFSHLPVVSILSCGHAFHSYCLDAAGFAAQEGDPTCILCESVNS